MNLPTLTRKRAQVGVPDAPANTAPSDSAVSDDAAGLFTIEQETAEPAVEADDTTAADGDTDEAAPAKKSWWNRRREMKQLRGTFETHPHLLALKPREGYLFRSDYFHVDNSVACVLAYFHNEAAVDGFAPFWGINRIPDGLDDRVTAVVLEQTTRMTDKWIDQYIKRTESLDRLDAQEQDTAGTMSTRRRAKKVSADREMTIGELQDGAAYLSVHNRLLLKAPNLEVLDDSIERIKRLYIDRFGTLRAAAYAGEQRQELSGLFKNNVQKRGKGFHYTSTELAGSYSLVTNGFNDKDGEYVGYMVGDVNNSGMLFSTNGYDHHVVIADSSQSEYLDRAYISNMWCSKLSQSCLLSNGSVVHLILDGTDLDKLGPTFAGLTSRVDLNSGDVNMFEMFGEPEDELTIFAAQMQKLTLMFEQLYESEDASVGSIIRGELENVATDFYIDQGMYVSNAKDNRHRLRLVGIPHEQVPRLKMFKTYIDMRHKAIVNSQKNDPDRLRAYSVLRVIVNNLLSTNGDLFNQPTATAIDGVRDARRVIYDFSKLQRRGRGVAMAQLVNVVGFAVGKLSRGDSVIIHGAEKIDDRVKAYLGQIFEQLFERGGRVVYSYNDVDKMLADSKFNRFDAADFTLLGWMRDSTVEEYQKQLHQRIPADLAHLVTRKDENLTYVRRGVSNAVFHLDLALGINPQREKQRRRLHQAARKAQEAELYDQIMTHRPEPGANETSLAVSTSPARARQQAQQSQTMHKKTSQPSAARASAVQKPKRLAPTGRRQESRND